MRVEINLSEQMYEYISELNLGLPLAKILRIASFAHLTDENNFIYCREAGEDKWLKADRKSDKRIQRFKCKNGNVFWFDYELDKVVKIKKREDLKKSYI